MAGRWCHQRADDDNTLGDSPIASGVDCGGGSVYRGDVGSHSCSGERKGTVTASDIEHVEPTEGPSELEHGGALELLGDGSERGRTP